MYSSLPKTQKLDGFNRVHLRFGVGCLKHDVLELNDADDQHKELMPKQTKLEFRKRVEAKLLAEAYPHSTSWWSS